MTKTIEVDEKEVQIVEKKVNKQLSIAEALVVSDDKEMLQAGEIRKDIRELGKEITERKKEITDPLNKALKSARALFAPLEEGFAKADKLIASKMLRYQSEQEAKRKKIEEKAIADLEAGKIKEATAERRIEKAPEPIKKSEDFHTRTVQKVRITPLSEVKVSLEELAFYIEKGYIVWDEVMVRRAVIGGIEIKGTEKYEEKVLV